LQEVLGDKLKAVYDKSEKTLPFKADIQPKDELLFGKPENNEVLEYGLKFKVDWETGQKTGFFIDQRESRLLVQQYAKNRDVLNMFGYTGGFSVYAMQGGARLVHSVDASAKAIDLTNENVELNFPGDLRHEAFVADAFEFLKDIQDKYDLIILDPPAFAKHRNTLPQALQGYKRINTRAFEQIRSGGFCLLFPARRWFPKIVSGKLFFRLLPLRAYGTNHTSANATGRSPGKYLPSRRRIPERIGSCM
jgi:23S rRNA (cytosine1962-C5)-methyltransferase